PSVSLGPGSSWARHQGTTVWMLHPSATPARPRPRTALSAVCHHGLRMRRRWPPGRSASDGNANREFAGSEAGFSERDSGPLFPGWAGAEGDRNRNCVPQRGQVNAAAPLMVFEENTWPQVGFGQGNPRDMTPAVPGDVRRHTET